MRMAAISHRRPKIGFVSHFVVIILKISGLRKIYAKSAKSPARAKTAHHERESSANLFIYNKCSAHDERSKLARGDLERR